MRRVSRMDMIIMFLMLGVIILHTIPEKLNPPTDIIYLCLTCTYSICLFIDTIIDSPFIHSETTRRYRTMAFVLISTSIYTLVVKIIIALDVTNDFKHFINLIIIIPLTAKLAG